MAGATTGTVSLTNSSLSHALYSSDALDATSTSSKVTFPINSAVMVTVQVVAASLTGTVAFKLQSSNDGTNFDDITGATSSIATTAGSTSIHLSSPPGLYCRLQVTAAGGAGTITPTCCLKGGQ